MDYLPKILLIRIYFRKGQLTRLAVNCKFQKIIISRMLTRLRSRGKSKKLSYPSQVELTIFPNLFTYRLAMDLLQAGQQGNYDRKLKVVSLIAVRSQQINSFKITKIGSVEKQWEDLRGLLSEISLQLYTIIIRVMLSYNALAWSPGANW